MRRKDEMDDTFDLIQKDLEKNIKGVHVSTLSKSDVYNIKEDEWVMTPSYDLNRILSGNIYHGIPTRSLVGIVGPEGSMKSSFMALCMADAQKKGFLPVIIDTERGCSAEFCKRWGIDPERIKIVYAPYVDQVGSVISTLLDVSRKSGRKKFIVGLDSLGGLDTDRYFSQALRDDIKSDQGLLAKSIKAMVKLFLNFCIETNSIGIMTGHYYSRPGLVPMPDAVGGGKSIRYFPSILISVKKHDIKTKDKDVIGNLLTATTIKNRITPPFQQASVSLHYVDGLDPYAGLLDYMIDPVGLIEMEGNTYKIAKTGEKLGTSTARANEGLKNHPELLDELNNWLIINKQYSQVEELKNYYENNESVVDYPSEDDETENKTNGKKKREVVKNGKK